MPDKQQLNLVLGDQPQDLQKVRLAGLDKPFEQLTINELVQLRPSGGAEATDSYNVTAVTDNVSVSTSSVLAELGKIQATRAMRDAVDQSRLRDLSTQLGTRVTPHLPAGAHIVPPTGPAGTGG